jgi:MFS superfamily sulfate permease-like transporter
LRRSSSSPCRASSTSPSSPGSRAIRRSAILLALLALAGVLVLGVLQGLLIAAGLSLILVIRRLSRPPVAALARDPDSGRWGNAERNPAYEPVPGVLVVGSEGPLFYANAVSIKDHVHALVQAADPTPEAVVLELSGSADLDVGALDVLGELESELRRSGIELRLAAVRKPALELLRRSGLADRVRIEPTIAAAAAEPARVPAVGDEADGQRQPVRDEPVGEGGEDRVPRPHPGQ